MKISDDLELKPRTIDGVVYIEYLFSSIPSGEQAVARWRRFASRHCTGKNKMGRFYSCTSYANSVIRQFRNRERERAK